jgi:heparan-alpha-glucosaminide N-acetyltransferase
MQLIQVEDPAATTQPPTRPPSTEPSGAVSRLVSLDAYRGLIMLLMISGGFQIDQAVKRMDTMSGWRQLHTPAWDRLVYQTDHVAWAGCSLWDMIQPSFMFMVGVAMAFSLAKRKSRGDSFGRMLAHALFRSAALVLLSIFLISSWSRQTHWSFTNVLAQIGLGYPILFLVAWLKPRWQLVTAGALLSAYWCAFAFFPAPLADLNLHSVNLPDNWTRLSGFASHWEKNTNFAAHVDQWFLNLFPRENGKPFKFEDGGYQTLNFVPSAATMIFGLLAGELLRGRLAGIKKVTLLIVAGGLALAVGWTMGHFGICPVVKRIWTPSWALFSTGWALLALALFYLIFDVCRLGRLAYPLVVVGTNSIAIYCVAQTMKPWVRESMERHFGPAIFELPGRAYVWLRYRLFIQASYPSNMLEAYGKIYAPMAEASFFLLFCWLLCAWAYRRRLFIKL